MKNPLAILCVLSLAACSAPPAAAPDPTPQDTTACWCPPDASMDMALHLEQRMLLEMDHQLIHAPVIEAPAVIQERGCGSPPLWDELPITYVRTDHRHLCSKHCGCLDLDEPNPLT